jgi:hypothetical protein
MSAQEQELSWHVASHNIRERSNDWFWGLGAIAIIGAAASIFFGNALLGIIIVLGAFSIGFLAVQNPREHTVHLGARGISIDGSRYPYKSVHSFWVEQNELGAKLYVSLTGVLAPHFSLYLDGEVEADEVRAYLKRHVLEEEQGPQLGEHVAEIFGL